MGGSQKFPESGLLPSWPKLLQKNSLQKYFLEAINFVIISKTLCIQLKQTRERPQKHYKNNCSGELFCNNFGQDGIARWGPLSHAIGHL